MLKIKKLVILILKYILDLLIPAFGLIALLGAGNISTFILGLFITILSIGNYIEDKWNN